MSMHAAADGVGALVLRDHASCCLLTQSVCRWLCHRERLNFRAGTVLCWMQTCCTCLLEHADDEHASHAACLCLDFHVHGDRWRQQRSEACWVV